MKTYLQNEFKDTGKGDRKINNDANQLEQEKLQENLQNNNLEY